MDNKIQQAIDMLVNKHKELNEIPKKTDFNDDDVCFIKQKLGPWPRALERAGIKEKIKPDSREVNREKRKSKKKK